MSHEEEERLAEQAKNWVKQHESVLIAAFASPQEYESVPAPISLFMAGSPGAGKTEVSKRLAERFSQKPVRIDADEIRAVCPGYDGANAHVFQKAAVKGVHILYDHALKVMLNLVLDGTFAYANVEENIRRSLDKGRKVEIFFVYQDPAVAWDFTQKREQLEGRRVTKEVFIRGYLKSKENVAEIKRMFGKAVELNLIIKDVRTEDERFLLDVEEIDRHLEKVYTEGELEALL